MRINTKPFSGQKPGTNGLRKRTKDFLQENYLENYLQSIFDCLEIGSNALLIIGGDGRYFNDKAIQIAIKMAAANGFGKVMVGQGGILSTPAASHLIRNYKALGGLIFSASHNAGGVNGDFGIKYNISNGGPAPENLTDKIYQRSNEIEFYNIAQFSDVDLHKQGSFFIDRMEVEIIDPVADYASLMQRLFDFDAIRAMFKSGFTMSFDAMHAVNGSYAKTILEDMLGAKQGTVVNGTPLSDFGGLHPDPNLTHAKTLYDLLMGENAPDFGAATDGDGDRNLIIGKKCFVSPPDSLAILAANLHLAKGYKSGIKGIARSMPTSMAADRVAKELDIEMFETPTGWKFFGSLLDEGLISICGEESFGTGSYHVREKDGLWAVLAWLNILAVRGQSVEQIVNEHWVRFGRNYYTRHDYEEVDATAATNLMKRLKEKLKVLAGQEIGGMKISLADNFSYIDPIDGAKSENQGLRILFENGSRIIVRMSGTGTIGATIRLYIERFEPSEGILNLDAQQALADLIELAKQITQIEELTGRDRPSVIT